MFITLARWWAINDSFPPEAHLIVPVSHGAGKRRVTRGAKAVAHLVATVMYHYQNHPEISFGALADSGNPDIEKDYRLAMFPRAHFAGLFSNTIKECLAIRDLFPSDHFDDKTIIICTDQAHSRRCRIVWKTFFPKSTVCILSVPIVSTVDPDSPMSTYHSLARILWNQAYPTPVFWLLSWFGEWGLGLLQDLHQPMKGK